MLPKNTILGQLSIFEVYEFYNMPVLFACKNKSEHIYLAVWVDESQEKNSWIYVPLSLRQFTRVRSGRIDLYDAFAKSEDEILLQVDVPKNSQQKSEVKSFHVTEVDKNWFPLPENYLNVPNSLPSILWEGLDQRTLEEDQNRLNIATTLPMADYLPMSISWLPNKRSSLRSEWYTHTIYNEIIKPFRSESFEDLNLALHTRTSKATSERQPFWSSLRLKENF